MEKKQHKNNKERFTVVTKSCHTSDTRLAAPQHIKHGVGPWCVVARPVEFEVVR